MADFLSTMASSSLLRADEARTRYGETGLDSMVPSAPPAAPLELSTEGFDLIAEVKLASPSEGRLAPSAESAEAVAGRAALLSSAGPAGLSVLTEPDRFDGNLSHLEAATDAVSLPVMRKDFLVDPIQVTEARVRGASGVLLIARILDPSTLGEMVDLALGLDMFCLVELFDEADIDRASSVFDRQILVGVNARNLRTLRVNTERHESIVRQLPSHLPLVAESGINTAFDASKVASLGYRLALVGTALTKADEPASLARSMVIAGRAA